MSIAKIKVDNALQTAFKHFLLLRANVASDKDLRTPKHV